MKALQHLRILFATLTFLACLAIFLDFTGLTHAWLGWIAKIQLVPAIFAFNIIGLFVLLVLTLIFGRIYCSIICPLGIFQDLFSSFRGKKRKYAFWEHTKKLRIVRYSILSVFIILLIAEVMAIATVIEPYSAFGRMATSLFAPVYDAINNILAQVAESRDSYAFYSVDVWIKGTSSLILAIVTFIGLVAAGIATGRGYCNTICPIGTLLGLLSKCSLFKIKLDQNKCKSCGKCAAKCKAHCIDFKNKTVDHERCVVCFNCLGTCKLNGVTYTPSLANMCFKKSKTIEEQKIIESSKSHDNHDVTDNDELTSKSIENKDANTENIENKDANTENIENKDTNAENIENKDQISETSDTAMSSKPSTSSSRRQFLGTAATATAGLLLCPSQLHATPASDFADVTRKTPHPRETLIIPPGAGYLNHFTHHCTGCMLCVRACPNKVLRISDDSRLKFIQPTLSFERGYCRPTCNTCGSVCPTAAIEPITLAQKSSTQIGRAIWNKDVCISATEGAHCRACARACPNGAITFIPSTTPNGKKCKIPVVDLERCIGCGACEYVCPTRPLAAIHIEGNMQHREI